MIDRSTDVAPRTIARDAGSVISAIRSGSFGRRVLMASACLVLAGLAGHRSMAQDRGYSSLPVAPIGGYGSMRYSSSTQVTPAWRALPSEARASSLAGGLLPSESRGIALQSGSRFYSGGAARLGQTNGGSMRYAAPPRSLDPIARPTRRSAALSPSTAVSSSTHSIVSNQAHDRLGSMRYGVQFAQPQTTSSLPKPYWQQVVQRSSSARSPIATQSGYGSMRHGIP